MADYPITFRYAAHAAERTSAGSGNRAFFWMAVVVVAITFFTLDFQLLSASYALWDADPEELADLQPNRVLHRGMAYLLLLGFGGWAIIRKSDVKLAPQGMLIPLALMFLGWSLASVLWSGQPSTSGMRWIKLACSFVAAFGISRHLAPRDICRLVAIVCTFYVLLSVGGEVAYGAFKPWTSGYRFSGGEHPNVQAQYCIAISLAAVAMLGDPAWPARRSAGLLALSGPLLILSGSRTAVAALLIAVMVYGAVRWRPRVGLMLGLTGACLASAAGLVLSLAAPQTRAAFSRAAMLGREGGASLTGRLPLWTQLWEYVEQRPLIGFGYGGFWNVPRRDELKQRLEWVPGHAHNEALEVVLGVGFIGLALLALMAILAWWRAATRYLATRDGGYAFWLMFFTACMFSSLSESVVLSQGLITLLVAIGVVQLGMQPGPSSGPSQP